MTRPHVMAAILATCFFTAAPANAVTLSLDPGSTDLNDLQVGDAVTINVVVSNLQGSQLASLGGSVEYPDRHFDSTQAISAGSVVPDPLDLIPFEDPGFMDGQFFARGGNIATEGTFFSFELTAKATGSGTIGFVPFSPFAEDEALTPIFDIPTNELAYTIRPLQIVPEPASLSLWLPLMASACLRRRRAQ